MRTIENCQSRKNHELSARLDAKLVKNIVKVRTPSIHASPKLARDFLIVEVPSAYVHDPPLAFTSRPLLFTIGEPNYDFFRLALISYEVLTRALSKLS
jgi:hypothetical protein